MPADKERDVPSSGPQQPVLGFDQSDLVGGKIERFIALHKISFLVQVPPQIFVVRAKLPRLNRHSPRGNVLCSAKIDFPRWVDGMNCFDREMHGKSMHLIFRMDNPRNMACGIRPGQELHAMDYSQSIVTESTIRCTLCGEKGSPQMVLSLARQRCSSVHSAHLGLRAWHTL